MKTIRLEVCPQEFTALSAVAAAQLKNVGKISPTQQRQCKEKGSVAKLCRWIRSYKVPANKVLSRRTATVSRSRTTSPCWTSSAFERYVTSPLPSCVVVVLNNNGSCPFRRSALLLEQFPMLAWFNTLAEAFPRSPRVLREHNDEPRYAAMVSVHERRARRAMALRELNAVTRLYHDPAFLSSFDAVVSISADDDVGRYGFTAPVTVVPAFLAPPPAEHGNVPAPVFDFGMFGSLDHGPNADAVGAFLAEVWPQVLAARPARLLVAGRSPTPALRTLASSVPSVELLADPPERTSVYDRCGAMVDPSVDGTGVAVKTLEALTFGLPVIGYSAARRGLSTALRSYVVSATSPSDLAATLATPDRIPRRVPRATVLQAIGNAAASLSNVIDGATRGS